MAYVSDIRVDRVAWPRRVRMGVRVRELVPFLLVIGVLLVRGWLSFTTTAPAMDLQANNQVVRVSHVAVGGREWNLGVRVGDTYEAWRQAPGGSVMTASGVKAGVPAAWLQLPMLEFLVGGLLVVLAVLLRGFAIRAAMLVLLGAAVVMSVELVGVIAAPRAVMFLAIPSIVAIIYLWQLDGRWGRLAALLVAAIAVAAIAAGAFAAQQVSWPALWQVSWVAPLGVALLVSVALFAAAALAWSRHEGPRPSLSAALIGATTAGREARRFDREVERDQFAQSLHDRVLPEVYASIRAIDSGDARSSLDGLRRIEAVLRTALDADQLVVLRAGGLEAALQDAAATITRTGLPCSTDIVEAARPPWAVEVAAWRIAQEALGNVVRHSSADRVAVTARIDQRLLTMDITDDGVGIDPSGALGGRHSHLGLAIMQERAAEIGARLVVAPAAPSGVQVCFRWSA